MKLVSVAAAAAFSVSVAVAIVACEDDSTIDGGGALTLDASALQLPDAAVTVDGSSDDGGSPSDAATCVQSDAGWSTDLPTFMTTSGATLIHDFDKRADGSTPVAGTDIPADEYLSCCGFRIRFESDQPDARLMWAGNTTTGFGARVTCPTFGCNKADIIVELRQPASAVAVDYPGDITATVQNASGTVISSKALTGSGQLSVGYRSAEAISSAVFSRAGGNEIDALYARTCTAK